MSAASRPTVRVDKWLWQTRFFKSRALAARVVQAGIRIDGAPASKPHRAIGPGAVLTFHQARRLRVVRVLELPIRRGPAPEAQACYEDLSPAPPAGRSRRGAGRRAAHGSRPAPHRRAAERGRGGRDRGSA